MRILIFTLLFPLLCVAHIPDLLTLTELGFFNGDRQGDFVGDITLTLSDETVWKAHPKDTTLAQGWLPNDELCAGVRTSPYWTKREHAFYLYNLTRNEMIRAMFVKFPPEPFTIRLTQEHFDTLAYVPYLYIDIHGVIRSHRVLRRGYIKTAYLSDGTVYLIKEKKKGFIPGRKIHVVFDYLNPEIGLFVIAKTEKESTWARATF